MISGPNDPDLWGFLDQGTGTLQCFNGADPYPSHSSLFPLPSLPPFLPPSSPSLLLHPLPLLLSPRPYSSVPPLPRDHFSLIFPLLFRSFSFSFVFSILDIYLSRYPYGCASPYIDSINVAYDGTFTRISKLYFHLTFFATSTSFLSPPSSYVGSS